MTKIEEEKKRPYGKKSTVKTRDNDYYKKSLFIYKRMPFTKVDRWIYHQVDGIHERSYAHSEIKYKLIFNLEIIGRLKTVLRTLIYLHYYLFSDG